MPAKFIPHLRGASDEAINHVVGLIEVILVTKSRKTGAVHGVMGYHFVNHQG